jgi:hypothetical protein
VAEMNAQPVRAQWKNFGFDEQLNRKYFNESMY